MKTKIGLMLLAGAFALSAVLPVTAMAGRGGNGRPNGPDSDANPAEGSKSAAAARQKNQP